MRYGDVFPADLTLYASNRDEYILINSIPPQSVVRWVKWEDLYAPAIGLLSDEFATCVTLGHSKHRLGCGGVISAADFAKRVAVFDIGLVGAPGLQTALTIKPAVDLVIDASNWGYGYQNNQDPRLLAQTAVTYAEYVIVRRRLETSII